VLQQVQAQLDNSQIDSRTVEGTNKEQLNQWVEDYGENSDFVKIRVRGMFPSQSAKQFISEDDADAGFGRGSAQRDRVGSQDHRVEPSWEGDDEFVIGMRQGLLFRILATYEKNDNDVEMANIIMRLEDEHQADAVFVDAGYGTGIVSVARTLKRTGCSSGSRAKSTDPGCLNKRSEMWNLMKLWLKEGGAYERDDTLHDELTAPETVPRLDGKIQLESKKDMKARGVPSPNRADCLAITFAHPVLPKDGPLARRRKQQADHDWDPYDPSRRGALIA
jgi:hypothetical protein